ncbi:MAG: ABC transporter ATP-binding protein [Thermomicrobiales bacterium]
MSITTSHAMTTSEPPTGDGRDPQLAIEAIGLRKAYGDVVAVENLTLSVRQGEVFGFLGPNGAGKSTTVKMLTGLIRPSSGEARLLGRRLGDREAKRQTGYLPEMFRFHDWLTANEFLDVHGRLAGMPAAERKARIPEALDLVGLSGRGDHRLRTFSKGMQQRAGLAQALIHRPRLIFLDEPTSALDPIGRRIVRDVIRDLRDQGTTVFLNSHLLSEVEMVSDRVAILNRGVVVAAGRLDELRQQGISVEMKVGGWNDRFQAIVGDLGTVERLEPQDSSVVSLSVLLASEELIARLVSMLAEAGGQIYEVTPRRETLEDLFVNLVDQTDGMDVGTR